MAWGRGDNSRANTISDRDWRNIQDRARRANPRSDGETMRRGADNLREAQRGNN
jgi:hypothetical protein